MTGPSETSADGAGATLGPEGEIPTACPPSTRWTLDQTEATLCRKCSEKPGLGRFPQTQDDTVMITNVSAGWKNGQKPMGGDSTAD